MDEFLGDDGDGGSVRFVLFFRGEGFWMWECSEGRRKGGFGKVFG